MLFIISLGRSNDPPPPPSDNKSFLQPTFWQYFAVWGRPSPLFCGHAQYFSYSLLLSFDTSVTFLCCIFSLLMKFSIDGQGENSESNLKKFNPIKLHSVSKLLWQSVKYISYYMTPSDHCKNNHWEIERLN